MYKKSIINILVLLSVILLLGCKGEIKSKRESENEKIVKKSIDEIRVTEQKYSDIANYNDLHIALEDTIYLGSNIGEITRYKPKKNGVEHFLSVIIENEYENGVLAKDTFSNGTLTPWFGVYAIKTGHKVVKGIVMEEAITKGTTNTDSILHIERTFIHFSKPVYVLDSIYRKKE